MRGKLERGGKKLSRVEKVYDHVVSVGVYENSICDI